MSRRKITLNKKAKSEIEKYPMVAVEWYDIVSQSNWCSFNELKNLN